MKAFKEYKYDYIPLTHPKQITDHSWPEGTIPIVTIRTMTYMHEPFIRECLRGILMQKTTFPVQVIIHDDASTDATADILKEYELKYPELIKVYYQKENSFKKKNRNELRAEFKSWNIGKYNALCEGDDFWVDELKLQKQVSFLEKNPDFSACSHQRLIVDQNSNILSQEKYFDKLFTQCLVYKREVIADFYKYIGPKTKGVSDFALFAYLEYKGKVKIFQFVGAAYRKSSSGFWSLKNEGFRYQKRKPAYDALEDYFRKKNAYPQLKKLYNSKFLSTYQYFVFLIKEKKIIKAASLTPLLLKYKLFTYAL